MELKNN